MHRLGNVLDLLTNVADTTGHSYHRAPKMFRFKNSVHTVIKRMTVANTIARITVIEI